MGLNCSLFHRVLYISKKTSLFSSKESENSGRMLIMLIMMVMREWSSGSLTSCTFGCTWKMYSAVWYKHSNAATSSVGHASIFGPVLSCGFSTSQASLADFILQTPPASIGGKTFLSLKFINHHMTFHMASKPPRSYCRFSVVNPLPCLRELFKTSANPSSKWPWCSWFTARENKRWTGLWFCVKMIHLLFVVLASTTGGTNKYIYVAYISIQKRGKWKRHFPILFVLQVLYRKAILIYELRISVTRVERKKIFQIW